MARKQINIKFGSSALDTMVYDYLKSLPNITEWIRLKVLKEIPDNGKKD